MKGHIGANNNDKVVRTVCRVAWAASVSPGGASGSVRQKRRRLRRTYQLERSSTREPRAEAASSGSYSRSASVIRAVVLARRDRIQRSSGPRSAAAGIAASAGSKSLSDAYVEKKLNVFQSVSNMSSIVVSMAPMDARVWVHGEPWLNIHHRMASAPRVSRIFQGSMMLPSDLDILRPSASMMCPRQTTWR